MVVCFPKLIGEALLPLKKEYMDKRPKQNGFTLMELLVVIAIIGFLAALVLTVVTTARAKTRDAARLSAIHQVQVALELYFTTCNGYPVATNVTLGTDSQSFYSGGSNCAGGGFGTSPSGSVFLFQTPSNPLPNGVDYVYNGGANSYTISFELEGLSGGLLPGSHTATAKGFQ
jgi:prepilin-type N-terminal cleavage/methylation domain-containing protein